MTFKLFFLMFILIFFSLNVFAKSKQIEFRIGVLEAFLSEDTQFSYIYRASFEAGLFYDLGLYTEKFMKCGYLPKYDFQYHSHEDNIELKNKAKEMEKDDVWLILAAGRSDHFLVASQGVKKTMLLSALANSKKVKSLGWPYYSMYPSNKILAMKTYFWVKQNPEYFGKYGVVNDPNCIFCNDFLENYITQAGQPSFIYETSEEVFNPQKLMEYLSKNKITSLLLPIYSAFSGKVIASLRASKYLNIRFIGTSGWGDELHHLLHHPIHVEQKGFSVRLGGAKPDILKTLKMENLYFFWNGKITLPPDGVIYFKETLNKISDILCKQKPKSKEEFNQITKSFASDFFQPDIGLGVFEFKGNKIYFKKLLKVN